VFFLNTVYVDFFDKYRGLSLLLYTSYVKKSWHETANMSVLQNQHTLRDKL